MKFEIVSDFKPTGDQPQAIEQLTKQIKKGSDYNVLLGVTGSGKSVIGTTDVLVKNDKGFEESKKIGTIIDNLFAVFKKNIQKDSDTEILFSHDIPKRCQLKTFSFDPITKV